MNTDILILVSGSKLSGKSTAIRTLADILLKAGYAVEVIPDQVPRLILDVPLLMPTQRTVTIKEV